METATVEVSFNYYSALYLTDVRGVARIFQTGGGGGVTLCQTSSWRFRHGILFSLKEDFFLKKRLTKGGSRAPQDPPVATPLDVNYVSGYF